MMSKGVQQLTSVLPLYHLRCFTKGDRKKIHWQPEGNYPYSVVFSPSYAKMEYLHSVNWDFTLKEQGENAKTVKTVYFVLINTFIYLFIFYFIVLTMWIERSMLLH